jgi:hypothetical protein
MYVLAFSIVFWVVSEEWLAGQGFSRSRSSQMCNALCCSPVVFLTIPYCAHHQHRPCSTREAIHLRSAHSRVNAVARDRDNDRQQPTQDARTHATAKAHEQRQDRRKGGGHTYGR